VRLRLATRGSALAWTQSGTVADALRALGHEVELVKVTTHGDVTSAPLASLGGAGVFVGAVRAAVLAGDADLAVHSFKDLPTAPADGLVLAAVPLREDPADALCARDGLRLVELPRGARVGTGSPRRAAQLLAHRPDLDLVAIRGNVETRLRRVTEDLDAVVLAAAGLRRLGLDAAITERLGPDDFLPAPAQGALAVECRSDASVELLEALAQVDDLPTRLAAVAERAVLMRLEAGCAAPVAARASAEDGMLHLAATVVAVDGSRLLREAGEAPATEADAATLGAQVAERLLASGAAELVDLAASKPKPLAGRRILLPQRAPAGLANALAAAGAELVQAAFTTFEDLALDELEATLAERWDWCVVTSAHTVASLSVRGFELASRLHGTRVAAIGRATASALVDVGIETDLVAHPGGGAALVAAFPDGAGRVLIPGAENHSPEPTAGLVAKGWDVRNVAVYRTVAAPLPDPVVADWQAAGFGAFVVTAGSVARAAVASCGLPGPRVVAIGEPSAAASRKAGLDVAAVAASPDTGGLVDAVLAALT
jgi:hydroxymethylbilane synthase